MPSPLPFPDLPLLLRRIMAEQPDAPHAKRTLTESVWLEMQEARELPTFDDVEQALIVLKDARQVTKGPGPFGRGEAWRLTQQGKLNEGKA